MSGKPAGDLHVTLLRGINVGGKHLVPMKDLVRLFEAAGGTDVRTYVQSGNVVARASPAVAARLSRDVARAIEKRFGFPVPVVVRTADEMRRVAQGNPFLEAGVAPEMLHVGFLADAPGKANAAALLARCARPEDLRVLGREVYLHLPNGVGRTKLTSRVLDTTLGTTVTLRNWRTVLALAEMTRPPTLGA
jgi:uncharacterized protein (DUF1697 family)